MSLDLSALHYLGCRFLRQAETNLRRVAHSILTHAPAGQLRQQLPIHLDDELDRVLEICSHSTFELERARLFAPALEFPATELLELRDAAVIDGRVYCRNGRMDLRDSRRRIGHFIPRLLPVEPSGFTAGSVHSWNFFGHWLTDQLATEWLASSLGLRVFASDRRFRHLADYRDLMNWYPENLGDRQFRSLILARDVGQNPSRIARQRAIRNLLRSAWPETFGNSLVYLSRGVAGESRNLINEAEIRQHVLQLGGAVIAPETMSVKELAAALGSARIVAGVEGSALTHAIMLAPADCTLLTIQPPRRFHNILKVYADGVGQRYAFTVADDHPDGFTLPCTRLERLLGRIEQVAAHCAPVYTSAMSLPRSQGAEEGRSRLSHG